MSDKGTDFPQYRKLSNNKVFYCIHNARAFDEIQCIGSTAQRFHIEAKQYPEILRIQDMLSYGLEGFEPSTVEEYQAVLAKYQL